MENYAENKDEILKVEDMPQGKLLLKGTGAMTNAELLTLVIGQNRTTSVGLDIMKQANNSLSELAKMCYYDLMKIKGIGTKRAMSIIAFMALASRRMTETVPLKKQLTSSADTYETMKAELAYIRHEEFWILLLNRRNVVIGKIKISQGGLAGTVIDIRLILKHAIERLATSIILCHNHPSGNFQPSESDREITKKMKNAASYHDIVILDHVIVTTDRYYSFADEGDI